MPAASSTWTVLRRRSCEDRSGLCVSLERQGHHVQLSVGANGWGSRRPVDTWYRKIVRRHFVQTVKHHDAQFKVYTLPNWQPVQNVTYGGRDAIVFPLANDHSSCSVEYSLELPQVDFVYASEHRVTVVDPTDDQCVHQGSDSVGRQHSSD